REVGPFALKVPTRTPGHDNPIFSPDGLSIAVPDKDGALRLCDLRTRQEVRAIKEPFMLFHPHYSPDGTRITASSISPDRWHVYAARTGNQVFAIDGLSSIGSYPTYSPDGTRIAAVVLPQYEVRVYDSQTGREAFKLPGRCLGGPVFRPDGSQIM